MLLVPFFFSAYTITQRRERKKNRTTRGKFDVHLRVGACATGVSVNDFARVDVTCTRVNGWYARVCIVIIL